MIERMYNASIVAAFLAGYCRGKRAAGFRIIDVCHAVGREGLMTFNEVQQALVDLERGGAVVVDSSRKTGSFIGKDAPK